MRPEDQPERRRKLRIKGPISARVRGKDTQGARFHIEATLDNLSAGGLYLRIDRCVRKAAELSFVIRLPPGAGPDDPGMRIAASGVVQRVEPWFDGLWGMGVEFRHYRHIHT